MGEMIWMCPKKYADFIAVDDKAHRLEILPSIPSSAGGGENSSAAYFLGHHQ
ncbi:hypothetical protein [Kingella sp. (in: b-proteobacteria)]|uniref:hypothetical protein n=1 Tax=Kingella sp. (in: b-proteobacteria) TaxID=2020713 RepID=UPI0026DBE436|nr:hypothetical protein [Kingella sp. (in: b-proteobacteria)]MDO4657642.1 hypothetical protein [Kingella sp. (in: b-proteobacteria)]